jgi:hypothetical protein
MRPTNDDERNDTLTCGVNYERQIFAGILVGEPGFYV